MNQQLPNSRTIQLVSDNRSLLGRAAEEGTDSALLRGLNRAAQILAEGRLKRYAGNSFSPKTFTVGIGNIAFGGSGKTPAAIEVARNFLACGKRVAVVVKNLPQRRLAAPGSRRAVYDSNRIGDEALLVEIELSRLTNGAPGSAFRVLAAKNKVEAVRSLDS